jgi:hypothetical protein
MHGINIGFGKDRGRGGNDWWNEDLTSLVQLADMSFGSVECFVTE